MGYVFGVACSFCPTLPSGERMRADNALKKVPSRAWTITSCGAGSKGERATPTPGSPPKTAATTC